MFPISIPVNRTTCPARSEAEETRTRHHELLQSTLYCRDGKQRLPTPDKNAVIALQSSLQKHRLRREQQLLFDIAQRCREQDVFDLSGGLTAKCTLTRQCSELSLKRDTASETSSCVAGHSRNPARSFDPFNKYFPNRKVKKTRGFPEKVLPQLQISYRKGVQQPNSLSYRRPKIRPFSWVNGPVQFQHLTQTKCDKLAPLVLPSIQYVGANQNQVDSYVVSKALVSGSGDGNNWMSVDGGPADCQTEPGNWSNASMTMEPSDGSLRGPPPTYRSEPTDNTAHLSRYSFQVVDKQFVSSETHT